ncbi:MAG: thiamine ABC transporter substrate binding subunit [Actinomycetota bacterium]
MRRHPILLAALAALTAVAACGGSAGNGTDSTSPAGDATTMPADADPGEVTLLAYDAFTPAEGIFDAFEKQTGARVKVVTGGDSGSLISKAILTAGNPEGDVLWGVDNTTLSRAEAADLLDSYEPVDEGDVCVNYDKQWYSSRGITPPASLDDLVRPEYRGQLVVQDPVNSSPGLAFLMATVAKYGDSWQQWWTRLKQNKVRIAADWTAAYTVDFSGSSGKGKYPLVVSYGSSPPAEVLYAATPIDEPPTDVIESTCFRQTEYVGVLRGTENPRTARALVDYLLAVPFQESMPLSLFVFPVNPQAKLPDLFTRFAVRAASPLTLDPAVIAANRDAWLDDGRAIAL